MNVNISSSFSRRSGGTLLAFILLDELGPKVFKFLNVITVVSQLPQLIDGDPL